MKTIDEILAPEYKKALAAEIKEAIYSEILGSCSDAECEELAYAAADLLVRIYVNGYSKGYAKGKSEVTELDGKTN